MFPRSGKVESELEPGDVEEEETDMLRKCSRVIDLRSKFEIGWSNGTSDRP